MNMFGLPDEVMDAIVKSAIRSQMSGNSRNPFEKAAGSSETERG